MANIAQASVGENWTKIDDLISGFSANAGDKFLIQNKAYQPLQVVELATTPTDERVGFIIRTGESFEWTKIDGQFLFVKAYSNVATFNIAEA